MERRRERERGGEGEREREREGGKEKDRVSHIVCMAQRHSTYVLKKACSECGINNSSLTGQDSIPTEKTKNYENRYHKKS